jgi:hypothetical protein
MGRKRLRYCLLGVLALLVPLLALGGLAQGDGKKALVSVPWTGVVPKATCGPGSRPEDALQGETTLADRQSGASETAYNCNLQLVGQFQGQGEWWQMAWYGDCAYYGTTGYASKLKDGAKEGVVVVDASDPAHPRVTDYLTGLAMLDPHESLKVNAKRKLLAGTGPGPDYLNGKGAHYFDFYDVSNCAHPKLLSQLSVPGWEGHAGSWAPDGRTYYGTEYGVGWIAIDTSNPRHPKVLLHYVPKTHLGTPHDLSVSANGKLLYVAEPGNFGPFGGNGEKDGLAVMDVSQIQDRSPHPKVSVVGTLFWTDGGTAQQTLPVFFKGKPAVIVTDETGPGTSTTPTAARTQSCQRGITPFGFARIINVSNPRHPALIAKLKLQVDDPGSVAACMQVVNAIPATTPNLTDDYGYSSHYCGVNKGDDWANNPTLLACGYLGAGVRVFDISDPYHPKEIAYYKPPAQRTKFLPGSAMWFDYSGPQTLTPRVTNGDRTTDRVNTQIRFVTRGGTTYLWFCSQDGGFQIVKFTNGVLSHL